MSLVLDSSVALSWCFKDEETPDSSEALKLARTRALYVPSLWHIEMSNVLGIAYRNRRLNDGDLAIALTLFAALEIHTDTFVPSITNSLLLPLMQAFSLTAYDAVYLELAMRLNLPLATFDSRLASASKTAGVELALKAN